MPHGFFGITVHFIIQKLKSKHLVCLSFLWWEIFWRDERKYLAYILGHSIGSDKQAVEWINSCLGKILELPTLRSTLVQLWLDAASKYTQSLEVEVEYILITNVQFISYSKFSNWRWISKLLSNFGCLFTFCYLDGANSIKIIFVTYGLASL